MKNTTLIALLLVALLAFSGIAATKASPVQEEVGYSQALQNARNELAVYQSFSIGGRDRDRALKSLKRFEHWMSIVEKFEPPK